MKWLNWTLAAGLAVSLSGCFWFDENDTTQLTENYQLVTTTDGNNFLYSYDAQGNTTEPLLSGISETRVIGKYLIVRQKNNYYLFITAPATDEVIRETRLGPLNKKDFQLKLYQLIGDSASRLSPL